MIASAIEHSIVNTKIVHFKQLLKRLISEKLDSNIAQLEYPDDFKTYMNNEPLLRLPDVRLIGIHENNACFDQIESTKAHPFLQGLIIVLFGIKDAKEWRKKALQLKVNGHYTYPFPLEDFYKCINFLVKFKLIKPRISDFTQKAEGKYKIPLHRIVLDVLISSSALFLLAPFFALGAISIRLESKGSVIYKSRRVSAGYKIFNFYKFRSIGRDADTMLDTMTDLNQYANADENSSGKTAFVKFKNEPRITKFASLLRRTSIDELPQLMSYLEIDLYHFMKQNN